MEQHEFQTRAFELIPKNIDSHCEAQVNHYFTTVDRNIHVSREYCICFTFLEESDSFFCVEKDPQKALNKLKNFLIRKNFV